MPRLSRSTALSAAAAALLYALLTVVYLRPIWRLFADHMTPDPGDPVLNLYFLKWGMHQIGLGLPDFWDANFFFPLRGALTLSDHLFGPALQLFVLAELGLVRGAVAGYNLLLATSFVLSGLATAWVLRRAGCSRPAAVLGGAMWAFSPLRWDQLNHLQLLLMQWIPATLWTFDRLLAERTPRRAAAFLAFYLLHLTGGCYLAYMIHVPLLALLVSRAAELKGELVSRRSLRVLVPVALVALVAAGLLFAPYARFARRHGLARSEREVALFGATFASYLSPAPRNLYFGPPVRGVLHRHARGLERALTRSENALFPGILAAGFGAWGLARFLRRQRAAPAKPIGRGCRAVLAALSTLALLAYVLADLRTLRLAREIPLGKALAPAAVGWGGLALACFVPLALALALRRRWGGNWPLRRREMDPWERGLAMGGALCFLLSHPMFFAPLMRVVPGLSGMRVPSRFAVFVSFVVVYFAARGMDALAGRLSGPLAIRRSRALFWGSLAVLLAVELAPRTPRWVRILEEPEFPEVYRWLAGAGEVRAILEVPLTRNWRETAYMYYSTAHWKSIANGFSGYLPPRYLEIVRRVRFLPGTDALELLRGTGITHLVVHGGHRRVRREEREIADWERRFAGSRVRLVHRSGRDRVYAILSPASSTPNLAGW